MSFLTVSSPYQCGRENIWFSPFHRYEWEVKDQQLILEQGRISFQIFLMRKLMASIHKICRSSVVQITIVFMCTGQTGWVKQLYWEQCLTFWRKFLANWPLMWRRPSSPWVTVPFSLKQCPQTSTPGFHGPGMLVTSITAAFGAQCWKRGLSES